MLVFILWLQQLFFSVKTITLLFILTNRPLKEFSCTIFVARLGNYAIIQQQYQCRHPAADEAESRELGESGSHFRTGLEYHLQAFHWFPLAFAKAAALKDWQETQKKLRSCFSKGRSDTQWEKISASIGDREQAAGSKYSWRLCQHALTTNTQY